MAGQGAQRQKLFALEGKSGGSRGALEQLIDEAIQVGEAKRYMEVVNENNFTYSFLLNRSHSNPANPELIVRIRTLSIFPTATSSQVSSMLTALPPPPITADNANSANGPTDAAAKPNASMTSATWLIRSAPYRTMKLPHPS